MEKTMVKSNIDVYEVDGKRVYVSRFAAQDDWMAWEESRKIKNFVSGKTQNEAIANALNDSI